MADLFASNLRADLDALPEVPQVRNAVADMLAGSGRDLLLAT